MIIMEICGIFEIVPDSLYSVQFDGEPKHEFLKTFRLWSDRTYLESFFTKHYEDLLAFWEYMSVEEAVAVTIGEGALLEETILKIARAGMHGGYDNLSAIFKPLTPVATSLEHFEKSKARGFRRKSWLRVYAIRLGVNHFIVTGGVIKLTRTMNEREHLLNELNKMEDVCRFLKADQRDEFGLFELF
ncbi:hypothetical protein [Dyadobacter sp. 676]|uniref:Uncharacterized protein n=1 Tax=Dyadobacter sp. 676 TaxID=3088362 RepID=A0AAU8FP27_9BACT